LTKVIITGAAGNIGTKLRRHFEGLGWELRLLDAKGSSDEAIRVADLAVWSDEWVTEFRDADAVIHLAGNPSPKTSWASAQHLNLDLTMNVYEAAVRQGAGRLVFASSTHQSAIKATKRLYFPAKPCIMRHEARWPQL
jgi:nucleoside-diphosphate-sugar epimerase